MNDIQEDTVRKDSSNTDTGDVNQRFKKCVRKGDIVCFTNEENIHMANNPNKHVPKEVSIDSKSVERISSGESLYKTFTFAQSTNDEDTEKCIAFWRSVMEKNLQPVRCSIVENREYQPKDNVADGPYKGEKESDPKPKTVETKQEVNIEEQIDEKLKLVHKEYRDMWDRAIKQMQKQKLDKIKLVRRTRCKMCETLEARFDEDICGDEATIDKEIRDLNKWKSTAKKKVYAAGTSRGSRSQQEKPEQTSSKLQKAKGIHPTGVKAGEDIPEEIQEALEEKPKNIKPSPNTNSYEFVDAVQNKLQNGKYSEWRSNAVQGTCTCCYKICCCNSNPAVKGIIPSTYLPSQTIPVVNIDKTTKKTVTRASTDKKLHEKQPVRSALSVKSEDISTDRSNIKKELSILIPCGCSTQSCDCKENLQMLSRTKLPEEQWIIPPPPELHPLAQKRSSIEIYKKKLTTSDINSLRSVSDHAARTVDDDDSFIFGGSLLDASERRDEDADNNGQTICAETLAETDSNVSVKKTVSLAAEGCGCRTESCDCLVAEEINRDNLIAERYTTSDNLPDVTLTEGEDTWQLTLEDRHPSKEKQADPPLENTFSKEETTEAMNSVAADIAVRDETDSLQVTESRIVVKKDSIELTHGKSEHSWTRKYSERNYVELKRDKQCYDQSGEKYEDRCGTRGKRHSIGLDPTRSNMNKLFKKISFSAKTCRCTNSRCDCYNIMPPEDVDKQEDETERTESDFESEVYADSWKERVLGYDSDKDSMNVIMSTYAADKNAVLTDDTSLAASQFLDLNNT